jgi:hypothetical protein
MPLRKKLQFELIQTFISYRLKEISFNEKLELLRSVRNLIGNPNEIFMILKLKGFSFEEKWKLVEAIANSNGVHWSILNAVLNESLQLQPHSPMNMWRMWKDVKDALEALMPQSLSRPFF